ncbi:hypothetical protein SPWS13_3141 [Shewanella putrefaciens]|nr:hypothetical protein SPWS13_3141 [Shewanella putrefaciens]
MLLYRLAVLSSHTQYGGIKVHGILSATLNKIKMLFKYFLD